MTRLTSLLLPFVAALPLLSCGPDPNAGKIKIRYMAWGNPEQLALEQKLCDKFNKENPDVHVDFLKVPGSAYGNKSVVMLASDTAPDVLRVDHYNFANLQKKRFFLDLTPYADKDPTFNRKDFFPQTIDECTVNGRLFGLNVLFGGNVVYYNKTLMREAGLEDPYKLWQEHRWTYDAFVRYAQALTKKDASGRYVQFGTTMPPFPQWVPMVWGFGGRMIDDAHKHSLLDQPEAEAGLQFVADLRYKYMCAPTPAQAANSAFSFESGKMGMYFDWMGMTPRFRNVVKSFEWDVVPIPSGPKSHETTVKGNQIVVPANCAHPEIAWRFMRFLTGPEVENLLYVKNRRCFPTRKAVAYSKEFSDGSLPPSQIHIFIDAVEDGRQLPIDDRWAEWTQAMNDQLDRLWNGTERDAKVAGKRAADAVNKVLSEEPGW
ncbi:MAG: sugar ABC transporter substrate-binding protein [Armatimonadetes bacterium]|nr:sugar ABC transporter substrate-binding protein [Armatimonadota bacterium]